LCFIDFGNYVQNGAVPSINQKVLGNIFVDIPDSKTEQSKIAEVLSTIDCAIEHTESLIAKYRRIKTGLMQDLLTRGIDEHGCIRNPATHKFKRSPLGSIPAEWEVRKLAEVAEVDRGQFTRRPRNDPAFYDGPYPFIQTGDVTSNVGRRLRAYSQTLNERGAKVSRQFPADSIAVTIAANICDTAILDMPTYFPDSEVGVVVKEGYSTRFIESVSVVTRKH